MEKRVTAFFVLRGTEEDIKRNIARIASLSVGEEVKSLVLKEVNIT